MFQELNKLCFINEPSFAMKNCESLWYSQITIHIKLFSKNSLLDHPKNWLEKNVSNFLFHVWRYTIKLRFIETVTIMKIGWNLWIRVKHVLRTCILKVFNVFASFFYNIPQEKEATCLWFEFRNFFLSIS